MNSSDLFVFAIAGAQTEQSIGTYQSQVNNAAANTPTGLSDWLKGKVNNLQKNFNSFVNSRLWEYSARLSGEGDGEFVGRFDIGYLKSVNALQCAEGVMRNYIMANPTLGRLYQDEIIDGYGGDFSPLCTGLERDNYFWRQAVSGVARQETVEDKTQWVRTHFSDTIGNKLTFREQVNIHKTWTAINDHVANQYLDVTSPLGEYRKDYEPPKE